MYHLGWMHLDLEILQNVLKNWRKIMDEEERLYNNPTLSELMRYAEELCEELRKPLDYKNIRISTDYGRNVIMYYDEEEL